MDKATITPPYMAVFLLSAHRERERQRANERREGPDKLWKELKKEVKLYIHLLIGDTYT